MDFGPEMNYFWFSDNKLAGMSCTLPSFFYEVQIDFDTGVVRPQRLFEVQNKDDVESPSEWVSSFDSLLS